MSYCKYDLKMQNYIKLNRRVVSIDFMIRTSHMHTVFRERMIPFLWNSEAEEKYGFFFLTRSLHIYLLDIYGTSE